MAEVAQELMLEVLKSVHAEVRGLKEWRVDVGNEFIAMRAHLAATQSDVNNLYAKLASVEVGLACIEHRLDLFELPGDPSLTDERPKA